MKKVNSCLMTLFFCLFVTQLASLLSCGDRSATGPDGQATRLFGLVTDVAGNPIEGVGIHLIFFFEDRTVMGPPPDDMSGHVLAAEMPPPPSEFRLYQNFPNPFNPETSIGFDVPLAVHVSLVIHDVSHREIKKLVDSDLEAGAYHMTWDGTNQDAHYVSNGVYTYQMIAGEFEDEKVLCLNMLDPEHIRGLESIPIVSSDHQGKFLLEYSSIPLGEIIPHTDDQGEALGELIISDAFIALIKEGFQALVENLPSGQRRFVEVHYILIAE